MNLHLFDVKSIKNVELRRKTFKTTQKYKSDLITMNCIDFISNRSKQLKLQKRSNYNELHRFDVITIKNVELRRNAFKTTQKYKSDLITMNCIDFISNRSKQLKLQKRSNYNELHRFDVITIKNVELRRNAFKTTQNYNVKTTKVIKLQWLASIWCQNIQNYKSDQNTKTCIDFMSNRSKQLKTQKYKSDQITINCIDLSS